MKKEINEDLQRWFKEKKINHLSKSSGELDEGLASKLLGGAVASGLIGFGAAQTAQAVPTAAPTKVTASQKEEKTYHHDAIKQMVIQDEGIRTKPYKDTRGIMTVGIGHNLEASGSKSSFQKAFGDQGAALHRHASKGGALTETQVRQLFDADYTEHLNRTIKLIPKLHQHPPQVQAALVSGTYRGHVGDSPTFRKHFNAGNYAAASKEFLNRGEYKNSKTPKGVITRLERDHKIYSDYAKSK